MDVPAPLLLHLLHEPTVQPRQDPHLQADPTGLSLSLGSVLPGTLQAGSLLHHQAYQLSQALPSLQLNKDIIWLIMKIAGDRDTPARGENLDANKHFSTIVLNKSGKKKTFLTFCQGSSIKWTHSPCPGRSVTVSFTFSIFGLWLEITLIPSFPT